MFTKIDIENYFLSYKHEHLFLLWIAAIAIVAAAYFYFGIKKNLHKGMAISLVSFAMLFFATSFTEYKKADRLRVLNTYNYDLHPEHLKGKEIKRITSIKKINKIQIAVLLLLGLAAIGLYVYNAKKYKSDFLKGIAIGMFVMCVLAVTTFAIIGKNLDVYKMGIQDFTKEIYV